MTSKITSNKLPQDRALLAGTGEIADEFNVLANQQKTKKFGLKMSL